MRSWYPSPAGRLSSPAVGSWIAGRPDASKAKLGGRPAAGLGEDEAGWRSLAHASRRALRCESLDDGDDARRALRIKHSCPTASAATSRAISRSVKLASSVPHPAVAAGPRTSVVLTNPLRLACRVLVLS